MSCTIAEHVEGLDRIVTLKPFRTTKGVEFDSIPIECIDHIDAIDRVIHQPGALSPTVAGSDERYWYMHEYQDDNLIVTSGTRTVDIYRPGCGEVLTFGVSSDKITLNGEVVFDGPAMLVWPRGVFHRIQSCHKNGSSTINFARRYDGFSVETEFNIYEVDLHTGNYHCVREGFKDQTRSM